jgi:hypothetical protein
MKRHPRRPPVRIASRRARTYVSESELDFEKPEIVEETEESVGGGVAKEG